MTPLQRRRQKKLAAKESLDAKGQPQMQGSHYEMMLMQLAGHRRQLSNIESLEGKRELKIQLIPEYDAYIQGVLEADSGSQDDVFMTLLLWIIDTGDIQRSLLLGAYALKHDLVMPERFERKTPCVLVEEISDFVLKNIDAKWLDDLDHLQQLTQDKDMPDEVRAKMHKALGLCSKESQPDFSLKHLKRAVELHDGCGVKGEIRRVEKLVDAQSSPPQPRESASVDVPAESETGD